MTSHLKKSKENSVQSRHKRKTVLMPICTTCPRHNRYGNNKASLDQLLEVIWKKMLLDLLRTNPRDRLSINEMKNIFKDIFQLLGLNNLFSLRKALTENINTNYPQTKLNMGLQSGVKNNNSIKENLKSVSQKKSRESLRKKHLLRKNVLLDQNLLKMGLEQKTLSNAETRGFSDNSNSFFKELINLEDLNEPNRKPTMKLNLKVVELSGVGYVDKL